jgi:hypothetical protein
MATDDSHTHAPYVVVPGAIISSLPPAVFVGKAGSPKQTNLVFYHGSHCPDGYAAAFAAWRLLGCSAEYIPVEHPLNEAALPDVTGKHVVCVDYAFSAAVSARMLATAASFLVVDHHASALKELAGVPEANKVFEMSMSGATMSWCYFHQGVEMPLFFRYLEDKVCVCVCVCVC